LLGLVVTYYSKVAIDRGVSDSSLHQAKANEIATTGMETVIGDLRQEIINGSTATTIGTYTTYTPTAPTLLPARSGNPSYAGGPANDPIPNLVRRSWYNDTNLNPRSRASQINSTADFSLNNHNVTLPRWNKHYLVSRAGAPAGDTTPSAASGFVAPDWVLVTRTGATAETGIGTGTTAINNATPTNTNYVLGRYAYAVYDEGGLIDVSVAGFPTNTTPAQYGIKGVSAFADLTQIPGITQTMIDNLVGWRNYAAAQLNGSFPFTFSGTAATNYVNYVIGKTSGFFGVNPISGTLVSSTTGAPYLSNNRTNQQLPNRQSLIQLRSLASIPEDSLQYLGTYSRELNAPSWSPTANAIDMGAASNGPSNIYAYKDNAAVPTNTPVNPSFLNIRVVNSFTRPDGSTASAGEPLVRRFPLTRLAGIGATGPVTATSSTMVNGLLSAASAATIQRDFGLVWDSSNDPTTGQPRNRWNYVGAGSTVQTSIKRLDQVATENPGREPNFFELLKAAILNGSVGLGSGSASSFVASEAQYYDNSAGLSADYQIIQIGANTIDQWDSDNVPTFIAFGLDPSTSQPYEIAGVENLPYLNKLVFKPYWRSTTQFDAWLVPSLWNPHQNAPPSTGTIRIAMTSGTLTASATQAAGTPTITSTPVTGSSTLFMTVNASAFGSPPTPPTAVSGTPPSGITQMDNSLGKYYGFHFAFSAGSTVTSANVNRAYPDFGTGCTFELQIQVGTAWKTYQRWKSCGPGHPLSCQSPSSWTVNTLQDPEFVTLDPRTLRFGVWGNDGHDSGNPTDFTSGVLTTLDLSTGSPPSSAVYEIIPTAVTALRPQGSMFVGSTSPNLYLYANNTDATVFYKDLDAVQRPADVLSSGMTTAMQPANTSDRPRVLNGAFAGGVFQSVAELGQVFRDQPWKTLNITSSNSADLALLDVFTLHETPIEAGKISLNTRQASVLKAILSKTSRNLSGASLLTAAQIDDGAGHGLVPDLMNMTANNPIQNKAELISRITTVTSNPAYAYSQDLAALGNKEARECTVRALSDACQTRTWNLLIDVIAQSGRYPPNAQALKDFLVSGEQHYWVHVAIDRFTGQVIDKQIEVVNE
jgi:hypothetical protein